MAVLGRLLIGSQQRIDLADFLSVQSYVSSDFRELVRSFVGSRPLILKGFEIANAPQSIGTTSISITVADSVLYDPTSTAGSFYSGLPAGNTLSQPIILTQELRPSATNYIYLTLSTVGAGADTRAFWDVDLNGGAGGEFNQTINTEGVLIVKAGVSTAGFPQGTIPVAKIGFSSSAITDITDCRNLMFRLGSGGTSPNPDNRFQFPALPAAGYARNEPPSTINSPALPTPFQGGDKNILTLKEWMDAVMTKLAEISGTDYWYESTGDLSLVKVYDDALASSLRSKGKWTHDENYIGKVTWTEDIVYGKINDPRDIVVRAGSVDLENDQVMWIEMIRNQKISALDTPVTFINGSTLVTGSVTSFQYVKQGDWIKSKGDDEFHYARIVNFFTSTTGTGSTTDNPSEAQSLRLETQYTGSSGLSNAVYSKGVYVPEDADEVRISDRNSSEIYDVGGNMYWLAVRADTIQKINDISIEKFTSVTISEADGTNATLTFTAPHGLVNGDRIVISNASPFDGTYQVETSDSETLTIQTDAQGSVSSATVTWAIVTTAARNAPNSTFQIESENHGFASGQTVKISNVTPSSPYDINGSYLINVRNSTSFQIPYGDEPFTLDLSDATATCAKIILKTNLGSIEVLQGEEVNINEPDTKNLIEFIGMNSLTETRPVYSIPENDNNTVRGYVNFNSDSQDSLTTRVSKLTGMMADRVQDRDTIVSGRATFRNTTQGADQLLSFSGEPLVIAKPGSTTQIVNFSSSYVLSPNTALIVDVDRNASTGIAPQIVTLDATYKLQENRLILFSRRGSETDIYSWTGERIINSSSWTCNNNEISQNRNIIVNEQVSVNYDGAKLNFASDVGYVYVVIPGSSTYNKIDVSNFTSGITISSNQSAWVRVNRRANKTFTNSQTSSTHQDTDLAGTIYITNTADVPVDQDVVVLYSIQDSALVRHHNSPNPRRSIYEEYLTVSGDQTAGWSTVIPLDSRNGGLQAYFIKGSGQLEVSLNGQILRIDQDYAEMGDPDTAQSQVSFLQDLKDGDEIRFRLASEGGFYTIDLETTTTLQQAYDHNRFITTTDGSPVSISANPGYLALSLSGDLSCDGNQVINANSSTDALRITQTGTGNALVIEDSANPDSTPFVVDADGNVFVGGNANIDSDLVVLGSATFDGVLQIQNGLSITSGTDDPSSIAKEANSGSIYLKQSQNIVNPGGFSALNLGFANGTINAIAVYYGEIYVGGSFTTSGFSPADRLAKWDGSSWVNLGSSINGTVETLKVYDGYLYIGGQFTNGGGVSGADRLVKYDSVNFSLVGLSGQFNNNVYVLEEYAGDLYIGGQFTNGGGVSGADRLVKWDGSSFSSVGGLSAISNNDVRALAAYNGDLYVGGGFSSVVGLTGANKIVKWNGVSFSQVGSDNVFTATVRALKTYNGNLYIGGDFTNGGGVSGADYLTRWNGATYSAVGGANSLNNYVYSLGIHDNQLYIGGLFYDVAGVSGTDYVAKWDGSAYSTVGIDGSFNNLVSSFASSGNDLYIGGSFTNGNNIADADRVVKFTTPYSIISENKVYTKTDDGSTTNWKELVDTFTDQTIDGNKTFTGNVSFATLGNTVIDVDSPTDALRITQRGSGNVLVVEDAASDTTAFVIDSSGNTTVGADLTVAGNLTVNGTTTTINTSILEVEDNSIVLNNGGTDVSAVNSGFSVEGTGGSTLASLQYDSTLASKFKIGANGSQSEIVTSSTTQSISGQKTFTSATIIEANTSNSALRVTQTGTGNALVVEDSTNPDSTPFVVDAAGNVGVGTSTPTATFSVGSLSQFQVNSSGNVAKINNVSYSWPSSQGTSGTALTNDGSGNLSWSNASAYWNYKLPNITANYTVQSSDMVIPVDTSANSSDITVTLPTALSVGAGRVYVLKDVGGQCSRAGKRIIISRSGSDTIDGQISLIMENDYVSFTLISSGSAWFIV